MSRRFEVSLDQVPEAQSSSRAAVWALMVTLALALSAGFTWALAAGLQSHSLP